MCPSCQQAAAHPRKQILQNHGAEVGSQLPLQGIQKATSSSRGAHDHGNMWELTQPGSGLGHSRAAAARDITEADHEIGPALAKAQLLSACIAPRHWDVSTSCEANKQHLRQLCFTVDVRYTIRFMTQIITSDVTPPSHLLPWHIARS